MIRLKELRKKRGLTQKDVAKIVCVSPQSYGYYENEINKPDPDMLGKLADFFNVSIDYLVGREDDFGNIHVPGQSTDQLTKDERELLSCFNELGPFERDAILIQIKALSGHKNKNKEEV